MSGLTAPHRNTIFVEEAVVSDHQRHPGDQHIMRFVAPQVVKDAMPGSFVHLRCGEALPMRRPMSIMSADTSTGEFDVLFKVVGQGTDLLSRQPIGTALSVMGPIGRPFQYDRQPSAPLLIGGGVGIPPMMFLANAMRARDMHPIVMMGSEVPFPFVTGPSASVIEGIDAGVNASIETLASNGIENRLASLEDNEGCFRGYVTDLADEFLAAHPNRQDVVVYACGPTVMLRAVAALAQRYDLPCQVSLEEYMACAVGGCAGCTVPVRVDGVDAMKRVCVDGPVFDARHVFFEE